MNDRGYCPTFQSYQFVDVLTGLQIRVFEEETFLRSLEHATEYSKKIVLATSFPVENGNCIYFRETLLRRLQLGPHKDQSVFFEKRTTHRYETNRPEDFDQPSQPTYHDFIANVLRHQQHEREMYRYNQQVWSHQVSPQFSNETSVFAARSSASVPSHYDNGNWTPIGRPILGRGEYLTMSPQVPEYSSTTQQ